MVFDYQAIMQNKNNFQEQFLVKRNTLHSCYVTELQSYIKKLAKNANCYFFTGGKLFLCI